MHCGDTTTNGTDTESPSHQPQLKTRKRRIADRMNGDYHHHHHNNNNNLTSTTNNNNNTVKNERLSPGTPDTLSRSRSVTPSSASYPGTPPAADQPQVPAPAMTHAHPHATGIMPLAGRNYSDFMRSLAAKYNNANPNDYFGGSATTVSRNGYLGPLDGRFKAQSGVGTAKDDLASLSPSPSPKKAEYPASTLAAAAALLNPFAAASAPMFPPIIDMSTTQTLLAMVRTAKEAEIQGLLKTAASTKRPHSHHHQAMSDLSSSPLDLSAAGTPLKRPRVKTPNSSKNSDSESPRPHHYHDPAGAATGDIAAWTVDDVCNFIASIDICAEYAQKFREQRIDGSGLPLLTEEHLTSTINMKLGPALKLRSLLARKTGSCSVCLHCVHCHAQQSPSPSGSVEHVTDAGGPS